MPANPYDSVYCVRLAQAAVHAAMSGRTEMVVGRWRRRFVHIPMAVAVSKRNQVDRTVIFGCRSWKPRGSQCVSATDDPQRHGA